MVLRTVPIPRDPITIMSAPSSSAALMIPSPGSTHCTLRTIPEACKSRYIQSIMFYTSCFILLFNNYYWLEKDCFTSPDFEEEQAYGGRQETLNFTSDHFSQIVAAVIWLKYCLYGVKHYSINLLREKVNIIYLTDKVIVYSKWLTAFKCQIPWPSCKILFDWEVYGIMMIRFWIKIMCKPMLVCL